MARMTPVFLITICWAIFILFWLFSAIGTKRYVRRGSRGVGVRLLIILALFALYQVPSVRQVLFEEQLQLGLGFQWVGSVLVACGIAFAIWARVHLGRNWGMPMSLKQDAELVTTGPYAYVRHPIYTGIILAMLGSTLAIVWWAIPFIFFFIYFVYSARAEEKIMTNEFPTAYPHYMRRTKMLIPFIF